MQAAYDTIGRRYCDHRIPDPRITVSLNRKIGRAQRIVNIGAGTGSYEPADRDVIAVEPSAVMIAQRPQGAPPVVQARAENLPFLVAQRHNQNLHRGGDQLSCLPAQPRRKGQQVGAEAKWIFQGD